MKRIIALIITISMLYTFTLAFATNQTSPVVANIDSTTFSVALPTTLPVTVDSAGVVTTATDASIINNSFGPVNVSDVTVSALNGWSTVDYDSLNSKTEKVNAKKIALNINNCKTTGNNALQFTQSNFNAINGGDSLPITYNAKLPIQATSINATDLMSITFTLSWDKDASLGAWDTNPMTSAQMTAAKLSFNSSTGAIKSGSTKPTGVLNLPSSVDGVKVTSIEFFGFTDCLGLTSVTIPSSITTIAPNAFYGCTGLTSITLPNSLTTIGSNAFNGCMGLTSVTLPNSITALEDGAFYACTGLTSFTIPNSITTIAGFTFGECRGLVSINIPDSVTTIDTNAFVNCFELTSINIPNSVTTIKDSAFQSCTGLTSITIPDSVTFLGNYTFQYCTSLESINIPNGVTAIRQGIFNGCISLTSIIIPNSITTINTSALQGCIALTSINIPSSVLTINTSALQGCTALTSITVNKPTNSITGAPWNAPSATVNWVG